MVPPLPYSNITSLVLWAQYANDTTGGYLGMIILSAFFVVAFAVTSAAGIRKSVLSSLFLTFLTSILLFLMGIIADMWVMLTLGGLLITIAYYLLKDGKTP